MITWPALIKHDGEDELIYISSLIEWQNDEEMLLYIFTDRDVLIDSAGKVFSLSVLQADINSNDYLAVASVDNMVELVRDHAAIARQCCIEKINCQTTRQAVELVKDLTD
ncbi:DUF4144 family protein [Thalassotalea psychrophila]|uniref:DUF4144 family protein n=1 Tax=Thalassotalea psychrophila TaxID=3065647 RepID=A0ABY9TU32_9GAMM|nr:DUF4144 family protein [Colwelliaceae bacterium SQ149]